MNWSSQIMGLKFLGAGGSGTLFDAVQAVEYATMMKQTYGVNIDLTNNSWGGGGFSQALSDAIEAAGDADQLFVAAAGNSASDNDAFLAYPASYDLDNIISVASTDHNDDLSGFSNFGETSVDLGAPGSSIWSTLPNGQYGFLSGTSMASPHVAGVAALLWSQDEDFTALEVKEQILSSVDPIAALDGITVTGGRLNALQALVSPVAGSIEGSKWHDLDSDGVRDSGEPGLEGWTIYLDENKNGALDSGERSTVTDADGNYRFNFVPPGTYTVGEVVQPGWTQTFPTTDAEERLFAVPADGTQDIVELDPVTGAEINRFTVPFEPPNNGPEGLAFDGSSLFFTSGNGSSNKNLLQLDPDTGAILDVDPLDPTRAGNGLAALGGKIYILDFLNSDIVEFDPFLGVDGTVTNVLDIDVLNPGVNLTGGLTAITGPDALLATDASDRVYEIDPTTGLVSSSFGLGTAISDDGLAVVNGEIYVGSTDAVSVMDVFDRTGTFQRTVSLPNPVSALGGDDASVAESVTDLSLVFGEFGGNLNLEINGDFRNFEDFADIDGDTVGGVDVSVVNGFGDDQGTLQLSGDISSFSVGGQELWIDDVEASSNAVGFEGLLFPTSYSVGETFADAGAAVTVKPFAFSNGTLTNIGSASVDNTGQAGGSGQDVNLNNVNLSFNFSEVPGTHTVEVGENEDITDIDFGNRLSNPAEITGVKWNDLNKNGILDAGEPTLSGWTIYLDANNNGELDTGELSTVTDADGEYTFDNLSPGSYIVAEVQQPGWGQTSPFLGSIELFNADFSDSNDNPSLDGFTIDNTGATVPGLWHLSTGRGNQPGHSAQDSLYFGTGEGPGGGGNFDVGHTAGRITSPTIDLTGVIDAELAFNYVLASEGGNPWDSARVLVSENGGAFEGIASNAGLLDDPTTGWTSATLDLGDYTGSSIEIQFDFDTIDSVANNFEGWYVDDVVVSEVGKGTHILELAPDEVATDINFGNAELDPGEIQGIKWNDINGDGIQDADEPGLEGWTIFLDDNENGELDIGEQFTVTDVSGEYSFVNLTSGTYTVAEVQQEGWQQTSPGGSQVLTFDDIGDVDSFAPIPTNYGGLVWSNDFSYHKDSTLPGTGYDNGTVSGEYVAYNSFANPTSVSGDPFDFDSAYLTAAWVDGLNVQVVGSLDGVEKYNQTVTVDTDAPTLFEFGFSDVDRVDFNSFGGGDLSHLVLDDFEFTTTGNVGNGVHTVTVNPGEIVSDIDFGNQSLLSEISGSKWHDLDGDGTRDDGEPGLANWTIYIDDNDNGELDAGETSTTTDELGNYSFSVDAGSYTVAEVQQQGWEQTAPITGTHEVSVAPSETIDSIDFGNIALPGELSGSKWDDIDGDGVRDVGESGLEGWTIYLDDNGNGALDGEEVSTVTDADGNYSFTDLDAGSYIVAEVLQPGWEQTAPTDGFHTVNIDPGEAIAELDFGNRFVANLIEGTSNTESLDGTAGFDFIRGFEGNDRLRGLGDRDLLFGDEDRDTLQGGGGDDTLVGGTGNDIAIGGAGMDVLIGVDPESSQPGLGEVDRFRGNDDGDTFVLGDALAVYYDDGNDATSGGGDRGVIVDFAVGEDTIQLHGTASDYELQSASNGTNIFLKTDNVSELIGLVRNVDVSELDLESSSFAFV
ncbi:SdrD B-like domain-containing protein [Zarconia navalis]|uniref:SdrD B-like domain-containing protein n=1 Tax=Zarconia navalis TaxID=2992134 RepID=UPI0021F8DEA2|nr:SdrD B-like domain-containing protein [Zarconia navalis]